MIPYTIFRLIIALALGAIFYILDRQGGTGFYRWWYGMTHEHPLPQGIHKGFVHNNATKNRVIWATILSSAITMPAIIYGQHNALLELALWLVSIPVIIGAFMLGPRVSKLWGKRDDMYTAVDNWERGDAVQTGQVKSETKQPNLQIDSNTRPADPSAEERQRQEYIPPPEDAVAAPKAESPTDPQELVNRFINRGKS